MKTPRQKIISKCKKLYRMAQENTHEGFTAQRQLDKLKRKHDIKDSDIYPIYVKEVLRHDKTTELSSIDEITIAKIPPLCGNEVLMRETAREFILELRGNDITFLNASKITKFILQYVDDIIDELDTTNAIVTKGSTIDWDSIRVGLLITIVNTLAKKVEKRELSLEKSEEESNDGEGAVPFEQSQEDMIALKRKTYDKGGLEIGAGLLNAMNLIPIVNYVRATVQD